MKRLRYDAKQRAKLCRAMVRVTARRGYADEVRGRGEPPAIDETRP